MQTGLTEYLHSAFKRSQSFFRLNLHRWLPNGALVVVNHNLWKTAWLRETFQPEVAKTGGSDKGVVLSELTLDSRVEAADG